MKLHRAFLWVMVVSLAVAALLGIWALLVPTFGHLQGQVLLTSVVLGVYAMPAFGCAVVLQRKRMIPVMRTGIAAALLAVAIWGVMIWSELSMFGDSAIWTLLFKSGFTASAFTVWATHIGLLMLLPLRKPGPRHIRSATLGAVGVLAVILLAAIWAGFEDDMVLRFMGALSIAGVCGTLVVPILAVIELTQARDQRESLPARTQVELTCPRCSSRECLETGIRRCSACGLRIEINVEEPRCACGYLLHKLTTTRCPECGRAIPAADRWNTHQTVEPDTPSAARERSENDLVQHPVMDDESDEKPSAN